MPDPAVEGDATRCEVVEERHRTLMGLTAPVCSLFVMDLIRCGHDSKGIDKLPLTNIKEVTPEIVYVRDEARRDRDVRGVPHTVLGAGPQVLGASAPRSQGPLCRHELPLVL